jgi:predicted RNase H-like nuclease
MGEGPQVNAHITQQVEISAMVALGVDGCTGGWVAARRGNGRPLELLPAKTLAGFLESDSAPTVIAVDIPIGLLDSGFRVCDEEARRLLGPRRNSVFSAPLRPTLRARTHAEASDIRRRIEGKGMTIFASGILAKVAEVDDLLAMSQVARSVVREVHPELCFYFMNGQRPMLHSKKDPRGHCDRLQLLREYFGTEFDTAFDQRRSLRCKLDDILDAMAALWTAERVLRGEAVTVPSSPPRDSAGLPMEMVA